MLLQYVTVLQGLLAPALLIMALNVMLTVGEGGTDRQARTGG